jgi:hypothetical protein
MSQPALSGPIHAVPVDEKSSEEVLREELNDLRAELDDLKNSYEQDRNKIGTILHALRSIFSGNADSVSTSSPSGGAPLDASRYEPWKQKFPGRTASAIDLLVKYETGLSRKQLASFLRVDSGSGSMSQVIFKLNKAGLISKEGNLIRLKKL